MHEFYLPSKLPYFMFYSVLCIVLDVLSAMFMLIDLMIAILK